MARTNDPNPRWQQKNKTTRGDVKPTLKVVKPQPAPKPKPDQKGGTK